MKKYLIILTMLSLACFLGCKDEDPVSLIPDIYSGTATAIRSGVSWNAIARTQLSVDTTRFTIILDTYSEEGFWRESLGIGGILPIFEKQQFELFDGNNSSITSSRFVTWIDDGDVLSDIYRLDTTVNDSFIQIKKYEPQKAEIQGIFNVSLVLEREGNQTSGEAPEKLVFTEGTFTVKVDPEWFE
ncbi:MAG: hypothetical protein RLN88_09465 [Ekhidna sp.]|uniref:hypothetical protein n=1 Tax=Ekhidna sp. TaxID=2608089 RepID=UPI0032F09890